MKQFIISILLSFFLFGFSPSKADFSSSESFPQLGNSEQAVWKIHRLDQRGSGTGFFIGPNHFITNFHVIHFLLNGEDSPDIVLSQKGNPSVLTVGKVLAISILYDLALLEIEEDVTNYLSLREDPLEPGESLFLIAYPKGVFTKMRKTGNIVYEDDQRYDFTINRSSISGASGGPVLEEQGRVVGVIFGTDVDILSMVKVNHLKEFMAENIGTRCPVFNFERCLGEEIKNLKELAETNSVYAQKKLAGVYYGGMGLDKDFNEVYFWLKRAAEQGHVPAYHDLAFNYSYDLDFESAFLWMKKAAEQGYPPSQYELGLMYHKGKGTEQNLDQAVQWFEKAARRGYSPAQEALALIERQKSN